MASSSAHEQLNRIKATVERAATTHGTSPARREAFQELIELTHSPHPSLKSYAAGHIHTFFNDFPDLEEDAINAVYDLCEDQDSNVRTDGYQAVTQVSAVQRRLVKRNADVLVQLLQSDEPEEVAVVKAALLKHLDMDPPVTLGVLCDQIVPSEEDLDDETRERLRLIVLSFLATDAMSAIQKYTDPPGSEAEQVLVDSLVLSTTRLSTHDVDMIVKNILLRLPRYRDGARGDELLQTILEKTSALLQMRFNDQEQLGIALRYLSLAHVATVDMHVASSTKLVQFYISTLTRKLVLQKFLPEDQIRVIAWIMDALSVSEVETSLQTQQIAHLRRQLVDASPILLEVLFDTKLYSDALWRVVKSLLRIITTRKELENWTTPAYLVTSISKFQALTCGQPQEDLNEIQGLIRVRSGPLYLSRLTPTSFSWFEQSLVGEQTPPSQGPIQGVKIGIPLERPAHLPARPVGSPPPITPFTSRPSSRLATQQSPMRDTTSRNYNASNVPMSPKRSSSVEDTSRSKRAKVNSRGQDAPTPSLLSRIADAGDTTGSDRSGKRRKKRSGKEMSPEPDRHPSTGYSIKGAASALRNGEGTESSSLLRRMRADEMDND